MKFVCERGENQFMRGCHFDCCAYVNATFSFTYVTQLRVQNRFGEMGLKIKAMKNFSGGIRDEIVLAVPGFLFLGGMWDVFEIKGGTRVGLSRLCS